jgi:heme/copper-type cytochrome/quinol oxidase subunit 2
MTDRVYFEDTVTEKGCHGNNNKMMVMMVMMMVIVVVVTTTLFCALSFRHGNW